MTRRSSFLLLASALAPLTLAPLAPCSHDRGARAASPTAPSTVPPTVSSGVRHTGRWSTLPPLPVPSSGHFAGLSHGALIVAGGSNFDVPPYEGGQKKWFSQVQVLEPGERSWKQAEPLEQPIGYGASVSYGGALICIGGGNATAHTRRVLRLEWRGGRLRRSELASLPQACANMSAALVGGTAYVSGGQESPASTASLNTLWALDLKRPGARWQVLEPPPTPEGRILPAMAAQGGAVYLVSGASLSPNSEGKAARKYLRDAWRFEPGRGWKALAPPPWATVAAPAAAWGRDRVLVFGGSDGALDARVAELRDRHPGFHREILSYDARRNAWSVAGALPIGLVTTHAVRRRRDILIPGGEDRPGHRSPQVLAYTP